MPNAIRAVAAWARTPATAPYGLDLALNVPDRRTLPARLSARVLVVALIADGQVVASAQGQVYGPAALVLAGRTRRPPRIRRAGFPVRRLPRNRSRSEVASSYGSARAG